jgi:hypothetical protein
MSEKTVVISVRLTPAVHAALTERAHTDRQPITRMAALLIEDGLSRQVVASVVPIAQRKADVPPFFRNPAKAKRK